MKLKVFQHKDSSGFTIIELLFATTVFALILLSAAAGMVQFGRIYYRGVITSRTQDVTRAVMDDVAQTLQFSAGSVQFSGTPDDLDAFCIGSVRYNINLDEQLLLSDDWGLVRDNGAGAGCPQDDSSDGTELLGRDMRLDKFRVEQIGSSNAYTIQVRVIYGGDDLFDVAGPRPVCKGLRFGGNFCAVSELETTVTRRISG